MNLVSDVIVLESIRQSCNSLVGYSSDFILKFDASVSLYSQGGCG
jgi:hypothetical protein